MEYLLDLVSVDQIKDEVAVVISELKTDPSLLQTTHAGSADAEEIRQALSSGEELIQIQPKSSGLDPATTAVIVAFAPVAAKITRDIWDYLILPRIRRNYGVESIKYTSGS